MADVAVTTPNGTATAHGVWTYGGGAAGISGTWVMANWNGLGAPDVASALAVPGVRGLSLRVPWSQVASSFGILDQAVQLCHTHHVPLAVRVVTGAGTPASALGNHLTVGGASFPLPWGAAATPNNYVPNTVFEQAYAAFTRRLATYAAAAGILPLIHMSWYGGATGSEIWLEPPVTTDPGYSLANAVEGYNRLFDLAYPIVHGAGLFTEFPLSGKGEGQVEAALAHHMLQVAGAGAPLAVQWNDLTDQGPRKAGYPGLAHARQMEHPVDYDWAAVYADLKAEGALYVEVYVQEFTLTNAPQLRQQIPLFP